jgi:hypothetical protein
MGSAARSLLVSLLLLTGCHTTKKVAVTTFRVIDAPARYIREHIDESETPQTTTTTTTTTQGPPVSDVVTPGRPVKVPPPGPPPTQRRATTEQRSTASTTASPRPRRDVASSSSRSSPPAATPKSGSAQTGAQQFPTAKPVPGKPGYVYSIDPKGGIVDVTGYKSGDKAKDPYTQQIFVVP